MNSRYLGIIPFLFFSFAVYNNYLNGTLSDLLWICNISNLILAIGIIFQINVFIRMSTIMLVGGMPLWILEVVLTENFLIYSVFTHIASACLALWFYSHAGKKKTGVIPYCIALYVILQIICRFVTSPDLNVNTAFAPYHPLAHLFSNYWMYNLLNLLALVLYGLLIEKALNALVSLRQRKLKTDRK